MRTIATRCPGSIGSGLDLPLFHITGSCGSGSNRIPDTLFVLQMPKDIADGQTIAHGSFSVPLRQSKGLQNSFPSSNAHARVANMAPARRRATYEDLLQVSDLLIAEIIDGEPITSPRPACPHAHAASAITQDLGPFARRPGGPEGAAVQLRRESSEF